MNHKQNPFTHTYGSAGLAYIDMGWAEKTIRNFDFEKPSEYVYKIVGVRGSGKTVVLSDIMKYYRKQENIDKGWLVYDLSSARDPLHTLVACLAKEKAARTRRKTINVTANAGLGIIGGSVNVAQPMSEIYYDDEAELDELLDNAISKGKRILVCIDDVAKTDAIVAFCSVFAKYIRAEKPVFLICTGLFSNMESIGRVRNLTFFRRAETIEVRALSEVSITMKYKKLLGLPSETAREMAVLTRGYAYGYQVLGSLWFNKQVNEGLADLMDDFDERLFSQSYEKIWEELREGERKLICIMLDYHKREDILSHMDKPGNYSEYRSALIKGGIVIESKRGEIAFALPHFEDYVREFIL